MDAAKGICLPMLSSPGFGLISNRKLVFHGTIKNADTGQVLGYGNNLVPTQHEGSDYVNLGAGLPANQIPAQVTAAYPAGVNGGSAYTHEYTYPHPLVTGGPSPTPTPTPSPTATLRQRTPTATRNTDLNASIERINLQWGDSIC